MPVVLSWILLWGSALGAAPEVAQGEALLDAWQLEAARAVATTALADQPDHAAAQHLAARTLHQLGHHAAALALLRGLPAAHSDAELLPRVAHAAAYAAAFSERTTPHFVVRTADKDEVLAAYASDVLEQAYARIGADLGFVAAPDSARIVVEVYPDAHGLAGASGLTVKQIDTSGTIAVCKYHRLMITSPLATLEGYPWADTLAHELTHLLIAKKAHNQVPIWLQEGLAKYFERRWRAPAGVYLPPHSEHLLHRAVQQQKFITFAQMHPSMAYLPSQDDAALAFAEVVTVVDYMVKKRGLGSLAELLTQLGAGQPLDAALRQSVGHSLAELETAWKAWLSQRRLASYPDAIAPRVRLHETQSAPAQTKSGADDASSAIPARLGELLEARGHSQAALQAYMRALRSGGARQPELVVRTAKLLLAQKRPDTAAQLLNRLLRIHPECADAQLLLGTMALARSDMATAQRHLDAARLQSPYNPELHAALAAIYSAAGNSAGAAQEKHFQQLCLAPRPQRSFAVPEPGRGEAYISLVTVPWGEAALDGRSVTTPAWRVPVAAGSHHLAFTPPARGMLEKDVQVRAGGHAVGVLR